jgi:hypothetical protein
MSHDDFSWNDVEENVIVPEQAAIAIYNNPRSDVVIRQAGRYGMDEDHFIVLHPSHALAIAKAVLATAGLADLLIVHKGVFDVMERRSGSSAEASPEHPAATKRNAKTAAERQRSRREKQRHDAERDISVTDRDSDRDTVTTAPLVPEFDLQNGGPQKALAN